MLALSRRQTPEVPDITFSATNLADIVPHEDDPIVLFVVLMGSAPSVDRSRKLFQCYVLGHLRGITNTEEAATEIRWSLGGVLW